MIFLTKTSFNSVLIELLLKCKIIWKPWIERTDNPNQTYFQLLQIVLGISDRVLHMDKQKPIYTLLLLQFVVGILDHVLYWVHGQPETNIFPTSSNCSGNILPFTLTTRNQYAPNFLLRVTVGISVQALQCMTFWI